MMIVMTMRVCARSSPRRGISNTIRGWRAGAWWRLKLWIFDRRAIGDGRDVEEGDLVGLGTGGLVGERCLVRLGGGAGRDWRVFVVFVVWTDLRTF